MGPRRRRSGGGRSIRLPAHRAKAAANGAAAQDVPGGGINLSERLQRTHASALHRRRSAVESRL